MDVEEGGLNEEEEDSCAPAAGEGEGPPVTGRSAATLVLSFETRAPEKEPKPFGAVLPVVTWGAGREDGGGAAKEEAEPSPGLPPFVPPPVPPPPLKESGVDTTTGVGGAVMGEVDAEGAAPPNGLGEGI